MSHHKPTASSINTSVVLSVKEEGFYKLDSQQWPN